MLVLFSLSRQTAPSKGIHVREKGVQLCPLFPIRRLLPKLSLANMGYNYINASVAGQCGQAARGSEISLLSHSVPGSRDAGRMGWPWQDEKTLLKV